MKITAKWLEEKSACSEGTRWFLGQKEDRPVKVIEKLMRESRMDWANWLTVRLMTKEQSVQYAIFAAEQVISIYEKKYPDDKRPREAIEAAKAYLKNPSDETKKAAAWAAEAAAAWAAEAAAARAAAWAAEAAEARAAAWAAEAAAARAARAAAWAAAWAAEARAARAARAAAWAAEAAAEAEKNMQKRILKQGIKILKKGGLR